MQINIKNIAIIMIMFFLISNQVIGVALEVLKSGVYFILGLIIISQVSPDLYSYIMKLLNLNMLKDIPKILKSATDFIKNLIPFIKKNVKISDEQKS